MNTPIKQIRQKRKDILLIVATAVLLALSINCATSYVAAITKDAPAILLLLSFTFLLSGVLVLKKIAFGETEYIIRLWGAIAFHTENESIQPIKILGYPFNGDFCEYLLGFLRENKAYAKLFSKKDNTINSMDHFNPDDLNRNTIINSVLEFIVLHQLDLHLNGYFIENEIDTSRIVTLGREQLGPDVLRNRVIDLITKDIKERSAFVQESDSDSEGIVVYAHGTDGAVYQRFDIELPPKSTIFRNRAGFLVISNRLFDLQIVPSYRGFATSLSPVFMPSEKKPFAPLLAEVKLYIHIKRTAFFTGESMDMYEWLDSFVERMNDYVSTEKLEQRLNPDLIKILKS
jgi:hypothetical protein